MGSFDWEACQKAMNDLSRWYQRDHLGSDPAFYQALGQYLGEAKGKFSLVLRINPFKGAYPSSRWTNQIQSFNFEKHEVPHWLGTNVNYYRGGERHQGQTSLLVFDLASCGELFRQVQTVFEWAPPLPDDFACFDSSFDLLAYANRHENEFNVYRHLDLSSQ